MKAQFIFVVSTLLSSAFVFAQPSPVLTHSLPVDIFEMPGNPQERLMIGQIQPNQIRNTVAVFRLNSQGQELAGGWVFEPNEDSMNQAIGFVPRKASGGAWVVIQKRDISQNHSLEWIPVTPSGKLGEAISLKPILSETRGLAAEAFSLEAFATTDHQSCVAVGSQYELKTFVEVQCLQTSGLPGTRFAYPLEKDESLTGFKNTLQIDENSNFYLSTQRKILAFNAQGRLLWKNPNSATQLRLLKVGGRNQLIATHPRLGVFALNPASGTMIWGAAGVKGEIFDISADGQWMAVGQTLMKTDTDTSWDMRIQLIRISDRSVIWVKTIDQGEQEFLGQVRFDAHSRIWMSGQSVQFTGGVFKARHENTLTTVYNLSGQEIFRNTVKDGGMAVLLKAFEPGQMILLTMLGYLQVFSL